MNTVKVFRDYVGEDLTSATAERLASGPTEHIVDFIQRVAPHYYDWLENQEQSDDDSAEQIFFCIDPFPRDLGWKQQLELYKKFLLYFPTFAIPDPIAAFLWPHITIASMFGEINVNDEFKHNFRSALLLLAEIAPAVDQNDIFPMPLSFAYDYASMQEGARNELQAIKNYGEVKYYESLGARTERGTIDEGVQMVAESVQLGGQLCAKLQLTPVAGNSLIGEILRQDYMRGVERINVAKQAHRITEAMLRYDVPGVGRATFERITELRRNEDAFNDWRIAFGQIIDKAQNEVFFDEHLFQTEFAHAADSYLTPRVKDIEKAMSSSVLEKILVPASLSIGAGALVFSAGVSFPLTAAAAAALAPVGWVIDKANKRFNKSGRRAKILKEFYGYLLDRE